LFYKKSTKYKIYNILFLFLILLAPRASYSKGEKSTQEEKNIKFWHSIGTYNKDILNSIIDNYNKNNKDKKVVGVFQGSDKDLYLKLLSKESPPDIVQIPIQYLTPLKEKGIIIDLNTLVSKKLRNDIPEKYWEPFSEDKNIYAVPFMNDVNILFVNKNILRISGIRQETCPKTWEDIMKLALKIKENTKNKWSIYIPMENIFQFTSFIESYTQKPLFNNKFSVNTAEVISSMRFLQDFVYKYKIMPPKITVNEGEQIFLSGNIGLMLASSSMLVYTESNLPHDLNIWHFPSSKKIKPVISGSGLAIIKNSSKGEREAFRFLEYLINYENSLKWHTHTGSPPIRKSVKESLDLLVFYEENPNYIASVIELDRGNILNPDIDYLKVNKIIKKALEEIMINSKDPGIVLNSAQKEIEKCQ